MSKRITKTYSKSTLLVYLINELSDSCHYTVTTKLNDDGCWTGNVEIRVTPPMTERPNVGPDDDEYYLTIADNIRQYMEDHN